jgi:two-component system OmpR family response regulator
MTSAANILVVDDDRTITALLCDYLKRFGYATHAAFDGRGMREQLAAVPVDLCVLDLMLPDDDGLALAREVRASSRLPIIILTARHSPTDRVIGLEMGADDYMSKPFEPRELVARIQTVLRRAGRQAAAPASSPSAIRFDGWNLDRETRRLTSPQGSLVPLSNAEYLLLSTFLKAGRRVVSREQLMAQARGRAMTGLERSIDLLVSRLRHKLAGADGTATMIKTVRGSGYLFDAAAVQGASACTH